MSLDNNISVRNVIKTQIKTQLDNRAIAARNFRNNGAAIEAHLQDIIANSQQSAFEDTLEDLSLALGSRLKDLRTKKQNNSESKIQLLEQLSENAELNAEGIPLGDIEALEKMKGETLSNTQAMLILASWNGNEKLSSKKRNEINQRLQDMIEGDPDWALSIFTELELSDLTPAAMLPMRKILQRFKQNRDEQHSDNELWQWFDEIESWPQRKERIRIMLRALSLELSFCTDESHYERLAITIKELKKLLIFLGVEEQAQAIAKAFECNSSIMIKMILKTISQLWIAEDWFWNKLKDLSIESERQVIFIGKFLDIIKFLPLPCFIDDDQREQILRSAMIVYERLTEEE